MVYENILQACGHTPLVKLNNIISDDMADILVKVEGLNVGGSIKTRTALAMIEQAEKDGQINKDTTIVEVTSGNQGIGLALVGAIKGLKVKIVMPDSVSLERRKLIQHYGSEVVLVHDHNNIGQAIEDCFKKVEEIKKQTRNVFVPQQFTNKANLLAQENTGREILQQVERSIDGFVAGIGTGGTISGIGKILKQTNKNIEIWAVEPAKAAILSGGKIGSHLQMGIGDGVIPDILDQQIYDHVCVVEDEDALTMAKTLASKEGLACGISSGSNVFAALQLAKKLGKGKTVVTILPDNAERYFSTELFDEI